MLAGVPAAAFLVLMLAHMNVLVLLVMSNYVVSRGL
jgi:hypothetical protein